ncbi:hypothetical protein BI380_32690 [Delftia tsuruhatensis]|uniref:Uncharacterized protein n=1 Tax=Delftia tsuruhatensis TaxID=180282 RepID=A0ABM6EDE3_9BURK|nr:hypothetical protein BI380_03900 [Delftia tsuruhatensis]AOV05734.1 hypothetical protein BI380_32690 [Delftia tsuruhatensis]
MVLQPFEGFAARDLLPRSLLRSGFSELDGAPRGCCSPKRRENGREDQAQRHDQRASKNEGMRMCHFPTLPELEGGVEP